jgi:hypothetical protein
MPRLLAIVLLVQLLAQASGLAYAAREFGCEAGSSEESHQEDCSPGCADCLCCPQHRLLVKQPVADATVLAVAKMVFPEPTSPVAVGPPREILHVPRAEATA